MSSRCAILSIASVFFGLSAAFADEDDLDGRAWLQAAPPLFQGIVVDAKGKTVGRLGGRDTVIRQINRIWVEIPVDVVAGFIPAELIYLYQTSDCTSQAYLGVYSYDASGATLPAQGVVATVPPATEPSIYFAGTPASLLPTKSYRIVAGGNLGCHPVDRTVYVGALQSVTVSSLRLLCRSASNDVADHFPPRSRPTFLTADAGCQRRPLCSRITYRSAAEELKWLAKHRPRGHLEPAMPASADALSRPALLPTRPQLHAECRCLLVRRLNTPLQLTCNHARLCLLARERLQHADIFLRPRPDFRSPLRHL